MFSLIAWGWFLLKALFGGAAVLLLFVVIYAFIVDYIDSINHPHSNTEPPVSVHGSAIYAGRVWHTRLKPTIHRFTYPIFFTLIDLDEISKEIAWYWWPIASCGAPAIARFLDKDHLKDKPESIGKPLVERVRDIVEEATQKRPLGPIKLLTSVECLGYCFNPVSFYYCFDKTGEHVETVVGEVSNTPWLEMHCYVLSPGVKGVQIIDVKQDGETSSAEGEGSSAGRGGWPPSSLRFTFQKSFHVSPFMDMEHTYDWTFSPVGKELSVRNTMLKGGDTFFTAYLKLERHPFTAFSLLKHLIVFPAHSMLLQVYIHWQAILLWYKQVPFFPHPEARETGASRAIAAMMAPLWALQERRSAAKKKNF